jgi:hypothetical protein
VLTRGVVEAIAGLVGTGADILERALADEERAGGKPFPEARALVDGIRRLERELMAAASTRRGAGLR